MMSVNGRPSLPSRTTLKRVVAAAVVAGVGAGLPVIAATGASAAPAHQAAPVHTVAAAAPVHAAQAAPQAAATTAAPAAATQTAAPETYTVAKGDWLSKIATAHNVQGGWQKLYDMNKSVLTSGPNLIYPGQHLVLSGATAQAAPAQAPAQAPAPKPAPAPAKPAAPSTNSSASKSSTGSSAQGSGNTQAASRSASRTQLTATTVAAPVDNSVASLKALAASIVPADQLASFEQIITHESGWNITATNPSSGAYGLPQALPGNKMASAGSDWATNPATQIRWALQYMNETYGSPNAAW
ncbi:LysM peptidoglycan-binding domain-containing protein, partial [Kitasatospora sp. NPDC058965]|uniref:LysM peptidoglycan-binding domain-containing protein n=1 Tax=Kitasatospora sp. NPDC058965 TaxID=3346682 RepID=UPI0036BBCC10